MEFSVDDVHNPSEFFSPFGTFLSESAIDRRMLGFFAQDRLILWERLTLQIGTRYDRIDWDIYDLLTPNNQKRRQTDQWSPKIGVEFELAEPLDIYWSYAEAFKAPDSATLIFATPGLLAANPNIESQIAQHSEIGVRYAHPVFGSLRAAYFDIETKKEILLNALALPFQRNENFDTLRSGVELAGEVSLSETVQIFWNATMTRARFDNGIFDKKNVPLVPENQWSAGFVWQLTRRFTLSTQATASRGQFALNDFNNIFPVENYWTLGGKASYRRDNWEIFLRGQNLLDEEYSSFSTSNGRNTLLLNPAPTLYVETGFKMEI